MDIFGAMEFTNNEANNAAAMELLSFAQVRLHNGAKVEFRENMGRYVYKKLIWMAHALPYVPHPN